MVGKVWGQTSSQKTQEKNTCIEESSIKRVAFFFFSFLFLLQTESCVFTWDLNQGTRLQNHPGRKVVWNCIEAEKRFPALKTEGWRKDEDDCGVGAWDTSTCIVNLHSLKPLQHKVVLHRRCGKRHKRRYIKLTFNLITSSWDPLL